MACQADSAIIEALNTSADEANVTDGMSGTGKSIVIRRLAELGYKVVDSDCGGFTIEVDSGTGREQLVV